MDLLSDRSIAPTQSDTDFEYELLKTATSINHYTTSTINSDYRSSLTRCSNPGAYTEGNHQTRLVPFPQLDGPDQYLANLSFLDHRAHCNDVPTSTKLRSSS